MQDWGAAGPRGVPFVCSQVDGIDEREEGGEGGLLRGLIREEGGGGVGEEEADGETVVVFGEGGDDEGQLDGGD